MKIPPDTETFKYFNANPKGNHTTDCVVRAICMALGESWEDISRVLSEFAISNFMSPCDPKLYEKFLYSIGVAKRSQLRKENGKKYTAGEFAKLKWVESRTVIAHVGSHHLSCFKDGKLLDIWDGSNKCVGNYWIVN